MLNECCWSFFHQRKNLPWTLPRVVERKDSHHGSSWFTKRIERSYGCSVVLLVVVVGSIDRWMKMNAENGAGDTQQRNRVSKCMWLWYDVSPGSIHT